ncbi:hypothetical protein C1645_755973 [Glomus cerebriforme]|uniref:Wax synthase domain-containing protein n=1 Tax=Glomus cerebriforme TaxID=658196 RepID=A0A397THW0_9GLOM|nr:hypothetical protein C1645_755973 [Glomus cerebriforme]
MFKLSSLKVSSLFLLTILIFILYVQEYSVSSLIFSFFTYFSHLKFLLFYLNNFLPQTLPLSIYFVLVYSLQFSFILLTLSPPKTSFHLYIIYFIMMIYFLLPLNYGYHYNCTIQGIIPVMVISYTWKMLIWLRECQYATIKNDKIISPFYHSLFWWRKSSFIIIDSNQEGKLNHFNKIDQKNISKEISNQNQNLKKKIPIISKKFILLRLISFIKITIIQEFWLILVEYYMPIEISFTPYPIRIYEYFTSSSNHPFFVTPFYIFYCVIYSGIIYWNMIWIYEIYLFVASCLLYYIQSIKNVSTSISSSSSSSFDISSSYNKLLIKLKISHKFSSLLEQWLYHFLFFTDPLFDSPHLSCSPSEFWSKRWQLLYRNCFIELGYLPCKKFINQYYPPSLPFKRELSHITGTFAGFLWSAIFHEYVIHSLFGLANGEHFTFFLFHGIIAIFWEIIVTLIFKKNTKIEQNETINYVKKVIGFVLWNSILVLSAPWFAEPYIRAKHYYCYPHFGCNKNY